MTKDHFILWPSDDILIRNHNSGQRYRIKRLGLNKYELSLDSNHVEYRKIKTMNQKETNEMMLKFIQWMMDDS